MTKRKFECWQCHSRFEADDQNWVECPNCHSDNVDYAHFHLPRGWWKWGVGFVTCAAVVCILLNIDWGAFKKGQQTEPPVFVDPKSSSYIHEDSDTIARIEIPDMKVSPTVNVNGKPEFKDGGYSFTVSVKNAPPQGTFYVVALDHYDHSKVIARSDDGQFTNLVPSEADGQYDFAVCAVANDSLLCEPAPRAGFKPQKAVAQRLSKEELQRLVDSYDDSLGGGKNPHISPDCKLVFSGLPADKKAPANLWEVADMVDMGQHVTITKVEYDDMNRISTVHLTVNAQ